MYEEDEQMRERLLELAENLDPDDPDTKRGKSMRCEVSRELIGLINELTPHRVTRVPEIENMRDQDDLPEMIEEAVEAGRELFEEMKEKRQAVIDEFDVEVDTGPEHGYTVELDGVSYSITYPDEVIEVVKDGEWLRPKDVEIPDEVNKFATKYWKAWDSMRSKMLDRMEEIGFQHSGTDEFYHDYRVGDYGPRVTVFGAFPREPHNFSIESNTRLMWDPHQVWDRFEDPAKDAEA